MATVKLLLERGRLLKNCSFSLIFRIIHQRCKRVISHHVEHNDLKLLGYIDRLITEKESIGKVGTAVAYRSTRSSLNKFIGSQGVSISEVDAIFVKNYEHHLILRGVKPNTICYYMRNFKSIYFQALCEGVETPKLSPFRVVNSKPQKTVKRALDRGTIRRINSIKLVGCKSNYNLARDLFIFSFLARGMPFVDMFHLRKSCIKDNTITYCRRKTGQWLQVALTTDSNTIIERYHSEGKYVFPMLNNVGDVDLRREYSRSLDMTNHKLKMIGKMLKIGIPLTTYVARHCWATQAKELGFSISLISEGLGHASEKITQIYLKEFDRSVLDDANERIIQDLFTK